MQNKNRVFLREVTHRFTKIYTDYLLKPPDKFLLAWGSS